MITHLIGYSGKVRAPKNGTGSTIRLSNIDNVARDYTKVSVHITKAFLTEFGPSTHSKQTYQITNEFTSGFSIVGCRIGAIITGGEKMG
jgi:hypothetical protein